MRPAPHAFIPMMKERRSFNSVIPAFAGMTAAGCNGVVRRPQQPRRQTLRVFPPYAF
jgi:hypothetical protein